MGRINVTSRIFVEPLGSNYLAALRSESFLLRVFLLLLPLVVLMLFSSLLQLLLVLVVSFGDCSVFTSLLNPGVNKHSFNFYELSSKPAPADSIITAFTS